MTAAGSECRRGRALGPGHAPWTRTYTLDPAGSLLLGRTGTALGAEKGTGTAMVMGGDGDGEADGDMHALDF